MRPVNRGEIPANNTGNPLVFSHYGAARDPLIKRIGDYCSYCESPLLAPDVEHIQPKSKIPAKEKTWDNFLLACTFCNSIKNDKTIDDSNLPDYYWPDCDNTLRAFHYPQELAPLANTALNSAAQQIALNTLELTGLNREPGHPQLSKRDRRWLKRKEAWDKALKAKTHLEQQSTEQMREQILDTATSTGFWSVWMTVFQDYSDMRQCLINAFQGTSTDCFDGQTQVLPRPNGQL